MFLLALIRTGRWAAHPFYPFGGARRYWQALGSGVEPAAVPQPCRMEKTALEPAAWQPCLPLLPQGK